LRVSIEVPDELYGFSKAYSDLMGLSVEGLRSKSHIAGIESS